MSTIRKQHPVIILAQCHASAADRSYNASYDGTVKIWDANSTYKRPKRVSTIQRQQPVIILAQCHASSRDVLACAQESKQEAVHVVEGSQTTGRHTTESSKTVKRGLITTVPEWGHSVTRTGSLLAAGYGDGGDRLSRLDLLGSTAGTIWLSIHT